jgi:hypothetical protein
MTVPSSTLPATAPDLATPAYEHTDDRVCAACAHPLAAHDPIGLRFCRATTAGGLARGCACRTT